MDAFYITTPIYYVNGEPHAGHAYTTIAADVLARYHRLKGKHVSFLTGVDEHGANVEKAAAREGLEPQIYCDKMAPIFQKLWKRLNISNDIFMRTTSQMHKRGVAKFINALYRTGDIYQDKYQGYYCRPCEQFFTDKELNPQKTCPIHKLPLEWVEEENYFFALSKYQKQLIEHINANPNFIYPTSRRNELLSVLKSGLEDTCISRASVSWGIPLPFDEKYISYVWIEALSNYMTAVGYETENAQYQTFWPADVHMMAKDITRFHALLWPAMLMAVNLPLPKHIVGHGWLTKNGEALSKTRGIFIDMDADIATYGVDAFRYYLLREFSFGNDGDYRPSRLHARYNADLANDLGNLLNRVLGLVNKHFGQIPEPTTPGKFDDDIKNLVQETVARLDVLIQEFAFDRALETIWEFVRGINRYIQKKEVWTLTRAETKLKMGNILYDCLEALRIIAVLISPFMPDTAHRMRTQLGLASSTEDDMDTLQSCQEWGQSPPGLTVSRGKPIFPRVDTKQANQKTAAKQNTETDTQNLITFADFKKLELRAATVIAAEPIEGTDKLLKLQVDIGTEKRQIVAGIAEHYTPKSVIGKQVILVANLEPATIRNVKSEGMLLAGRGEPVVLATLDAEVPPGSTIR